MLKTVVKSAFLVTALSIAAGCASTDNTQLIEENKKAAADASETAKQALKVANEASRKADAAMSAARSAQDCCTETQEKINRSFEKSMRK